MRPSFCDPKGGDMGTFEFDGEKYKKASEHQKEWGNDLIAQMRLRGDETILDLGCGDGVLTERLAQSVPGGAVLGVDASRGMIETARRIERENLRFIQMDINDLDFEEQFDIIYSNAALHWVKDHELLLKNSLRALKSGGRIYWNFAGAGTCAAFNDITRGIIQKPEYADFFTGFEWPWVMLPAGEYERMARAAGFTAIRIEEENKDRCFADADELTGWIDQPSIVPFLHEVPEEKKERFRQEVITEMLGRTRQPDGTYFETFRRINICAQRREV